MATPLQQYLIDRKIKLLNQEKQAIGYAKDSIVMQIQVFDVILQFLAFQQTEEDMDKLDLMLDSQIIPVKQLKPRQENAELTDALVVVAEKLKKAWEDQVKKAAKDKKEPEDLATYLKNIPSNVIPHSIVTKVYDMRKKLKVPANIVPGSRTIKSAEEAKEYGLAWNGEPYEAVFVKWTQNPPPLDRTRRKKGE